MYDYFFDDPKYDAETFTELFPLSIELFIKIMEDIEITLNGFK